MMARVDLDALLLLLARQSPPGLTDAEVTERIRKVLLGLLAGEDLPGPVPFDRASLQAWFQSTFGGEADPAAALYQHLLGRVVVRTADGGLVVRRERGAHRATGAYYTASDIVRYMLERVRNWLPDARAVIDPACGAGAFLSGAATAYSDRSLRLAGLDPDPTALALCSQVVPEAELRLADALLDEVPGGYDLCVGNPPYISSGLRGVRSLAPERAAALRQRYPASAQYKLNTYPLFIERGLELLRPGGILAYILPDSFLVGKYFERTRQLLLSHTILELSLICQDFWEHGRVGQSVILVVQKAPPPPGHRVWVKVCRDVAGLLEDAGTDIPLDDLVWGAAQRFRLVPDPARRSWIRAVETVPESRPLGTLLRSYSGLIARGGQTSLLRSANPTAAGPWGRLLRSGREIDRYHLNWEGEEVRLDPTLIKSGGQLAYYQNPKILLRQTADSLRAVYDDQGYYCLNNIHVLVPREPSTDLRALLGFINSGPVERYYRTLAMESDRLYAQVDLDLLAEIPVPPLSDEDERTLLRLVRQRESAASQEAAQLEAMIDRLVARAFHLAP